MQRTQEDKATKTANKQGDNKYKVENLLSGRAWFESTLRHVPSLYVNNAEIREQKSIVYFFSLFPHLKVSPNGRVPEKELFMMSLGELILLSVQ